MKKLLITLAVTALSIAAIAVEKPRLTSHRGGRAEYDDNAVGGFKQSLAAGLTRFETDVRLTKDGALVIMHDDNPQRTTTYKGNLKINQMTLAEVQSLTLKKSGEHVPSMQQVADVFRGRKDVYVEWELKEAPSGKAGEDYCHKLYSVASKTMEPGTYIFIGFNTEILKTMKRLYPDAPIGLTTWEPLTPAFVDRAVAMGCCSVQPGFSSSKEAIAYAHQKGLAVAVWMVNDYGSWKKARDNGADAVTTDCPKQILQAIKAGK